MEERGRCQRTHGSSEPIFNDSFRSSSQRLHIPAPQESLALSKLRRRVLLLITVAYAVNQIDRGNLSMAAAQMSLPSELNLSKEDFHSQRDSRGNKGAGKQSYGKQAGGKHAHPYAKGGYAAQPQYAQPQANGYGGYAPQYG